MAAKKTKLAKDANPDPITGEPGSHPVGTGVGAALAGAAAGAAGGSIAGPVGTVVGAAAGAVAGGLAGKAVEESFDPTTEDGYWRNEYRNRSYVEQDTTYDTYRPAYQYGWETRSRYPGRRFEDVETDLERDWNSRRSDTSLTWERAKHAVRDAWNRLTGDDTSDRRLPR